MYQVNVNDRDFKVEVKGNGAEVLLNGAALELDLKGDAKKGFHLIKDRKSYQIQVLESDLESKEFLVEVNGQTFPVKGSDRFDLLLRDLGMEHLANAAVNDLKAPMPGLVLDVKVAPGDSIKKGQAILVLEAMKMENVLKAESDAVVKSINCETGQAVEKNQILIEFEV
jgi:biotin carboxyl carrier protein